MALLNLRGMIFIVGLTMSIRGNAFRVKPRVRLPEERHDPNIETFSTLFYQKDMPNIKKWQRTFIFDITSRNYPHNIALHSWGNFYRAGVVLKDPRYTGGNIGSGIGYSQDTQQLTAQRCYNATIGFVSGKQSFVQVNQAISSIELQKQLGISVSLSTSIGQFSADAKASYVRSIQDNEYAMSLNYYLYSTNKVSIQMAGRGANALTEIGKFFYQDGRNPYFGLVCGDHIIKSYQQGVLLTMGLYIKFRSSTDKTKFEQSAGGSFGSIVSAAEKIKIVSTQHKLTGSVSIQAFQIGGEPSQLSKILNKDSDDNFYALTCSIKAIENCKKTASGLLDYATNNLPTQYSFETNVGLTPLGVAFSEYQPITWLKLVVPASLVTQDVVKYRNELSSKLKEMNYYQQKLYPFLNNGYPVKMDKVFLNAARAILSKVNKNMHILMQPHRGAADCYYFPNDCKNIKARIYPELRSIKISNLSIFNNIKYRILMSTGIWYNSGKDSGKSWIFKRYDPKLIDKIDNVEVTDTSFNYYLETNPNNVENKECFSGTVHSNPMKYEGSIWIDIFRPYDAVATKEISLFFFKPYSELNGANKNKMKIKLNVVINRPKNVTL